MITAIRLIADDLRRTPANALVAMALVMIGWTRVALGGAAQGPAAFSMSIVSVLSLLAFTSFVQRPVHYLPVSRREIWQAQWLLSTLVATLITATGKLLALLLQRLSPVADGAANFGVALEPVMLSSLCDFAYGGSFPAAVGLMRLVRRRTGRGLVTNASFALLCVWFIGGVFWGFYVAPYLPLRWGDLAGAPGAALGAALVLAILAGRHAPPLTARGPLPRAIGPRSTASAASASSLGSFGRLTGIPMLVAREVAVNAVVVAVLCLALFCARALFLNDIGQAIGELRSLAGGANRYIAGVLPLPWALFIVFMAVRNGLQPLIRQLRAMPISGARLNALMLGTSTLGVATLYVMLVLLRLILAGQLPQLDDLEMFVVLSGIATLTQSIQLRRREPWSMVGIGVVIAIGLAGGLLQEVPMARPLAAPTVFGGAAIALAYALNHWWLTRSAMTYRPSGAPKLALSD